MSAIYITNWRMQFNCWICVLDSWNKFYCVFGTHLISGKLLEWNEIKLEFKWMVTQLHTCGVIISSNSEFCNYSSSQFGIVELDYWYVDSTVCLVSAPLVLYIKLHLRILCTLCVIIKEVIIVNLWLFSHLKQSSLGWSALSYRNHAYAILKMPSLL